MSTNKSPIISKSILTGLVIIIIPMLAYFGLKDNMQALLNQGRVISRVAIIDSFPQSSTTISSVSMTADISDSVTTPLFAASSWTLLGPSDGHVNGVVFTPTGALLAGTNSGGVFITENGGSTWAPFSDGLISHHINQIKNINGDIYIAADDGVYKLVGSSWNLVYTPPSSFGEVLSLTNNGSIIFALGKNGVVKMQSGVWTLATSPGNNLFTIFSSSNGTLYVGGFSGLYESIDSGIKWTQPFTISGVFGIIEGLPGDIYITTASGQLYKQTGNSIFTLLTAISNTGTGILAYQNGKLLVGSTSDIYQSLDNGNSFSLLAENYNHNLGGFWDIRQMLFVGTSYLYISHDNGISKYDFSSEIMTKIPSINYYSEVTSLAVDSTQNLETTYWDHFSKYLAKSTLSWSDVPFGGEMDYLFASPKDSMLYVDANNSTVSIFNASSSLLWNRSVINNNPKSSVGFGLQSSPTRVYVLYQDQSSVAKIKSFNLTSNMDSINETDITLPFMFPSSIAVDPSNQMHIIVHANDKFYESANGGLTWDNGIVLFYQNVQLACFSQAINPFNSREYLASCIGKDGGLVIKVSNGQITSVGLPIATDIHNGEYVFSYDPKHKGVIYAGAITGFFYSINNGRTWRSFNNGLYTNYIRSITSTGNEVYIGTWGSGNAVKSIQHR